MSMRSDSDHDHDWIDENERLEDNPLWIQDHVTLNTVGIDIGSAGTQIIFSRINLRRLGEDLSSRYFVVSRETLFQSPVALTPYSSEERIDEAKLGAIIDDAYDAAKIHPDDIDTGVVILTGEALRRENSQAIAGVLAEQGGEFVTATAGHHMEAMLAAYGSGAARVSSDEGKRILNIDIGGGTTKLGLVEKGKVLATAAFHVGGRLQVVDKDGRSSGSIRPGSITPGRPVSTGSWATVARPQQMDAVAEKMADTVVDAIKTRPLPHDVAHLYLTDPIPDSAISTASCSPAALLNMSTSASSATSATWAFGSAARCASGIESGALPWPFLPAGECIRATALGASEYSVQLTGNTSFISSPGLAAAAAKPAGGAAALCLRRRHRSRRTGAAIRSHFTAFDIAHDGDAEVALAFRWLGAPSYERIAAFAEGIKRAMAERLAKRAGALRHAGRRRGADAGRDPARGKAGRQRDPGDRRRGAVGLRLYRPRPHPHAVQYCAGDHQVAGL